MSADYYNYAVCVKRTITNSRTFFEALLYDEDCKVVDGVVSNNRLFAYFSIYKLIVKHCKVRVSHKLYLIMRLAGYYFYLAAN